MRKDLLEILQRAQADSLGFLLIRCGQLWNERGIATVNAEVGGPTLREAHTRLLPHLQRQEGIRITELAAVVGVTKQAVQPIVAELAAMGVVRIERDPEDARARRVTLTRFGIEAMLHGTGLLRRIEAELAPQLGRTHVAALKRQLRRVLAVLQGPPQKAKAGAR